MPRPDRRQLITDAALELAAAGGTHAITHLAVDRHLDLPKGSTSYYFRTREDLIAATADRLLIRSRAAFERDLAIGDASPDRVIRDYMTTLLTERRTDALARQALLLDAALPTETGDILARCLFSTDAAIALMTGRGSTDPRADADRLITLLEGAVFAVTHGLHRKSDADHIAEFIGNLIAPLFAEPRTLATGEITPAGDVSVLRQQSSP
ncbi:TetR family transcriptional regulator [Gordonia sp. NB41Y]|uniref:TetR/AcrR family transcriptional regulator n=1 Tax=Gordonia sp. NB41Y TaxID=875808 RepID=UPI000345AC6A|nr:TetR family transcriptional regulator [Gordonia sp. NB41Y]EMP13310.2 hypothetical protein ISGA_919 [Gordonia sp. NB41Y]WLP89218.1 TetR family transcriptional regulator [Gordonia sp. NB41Y]